MLPLAQTSLTLGARPQVKKSKRSDKLEPNLLVKTRAARRIFADARREKMAVEHVMQLPAPDESLHIVIDGRFEPCDMIPAIRRLSDPATIARLYVTTLSFNEDNIACLCNGIDQGKISSLVLICSQYFEKTERALFALAKLELEKRSCRIRSLRTHTKLMLLEMSDGRHFTIEGSGNLRSCRSIEQFVITNNRELLHFHRKWIDDYLDRATKK